MGPCKLCGGTQFNQGYCTNCGHQAPVPARTNPLPVVLVGLGILVAVCVVASVVGIGLWQWNRTESPTATSPTRSPASPAQSPASPPPTNTSAPPLTGPACLVGRWRETVYQADAVINGVTVRMTGAGTIQEFGSAGVLTYDAGAGTTITGTSGGNTYTATSIGKFTINYQVVGTEIHYSNSQSSGGTRVWKRDGRQIEKETLIGSLAPETFTCTGTELRLFSTDYSIELERVTA